MVWFNVLFCKQVSHTESGDIMLNFAICDDNHLHNSRLETFLLRYEKESNQTYHIDIFQSGTSLLHHILKMGKQYQILFLDIEMKSLNGIETAKKIRMYDKDCLLIYITSYDQYTLESFEVSPFRYLLKPITYPVIAKILHIAIDEIFSSNQYLFIKKYHNNYQIRFDNIIGIFSENHRQIRLAIKGPQQMLIFYGKIKNIEQQINPTIFAKVNRGTIVNMNSICSIIDTIITLENKERVPISRGYKKRFKTLYNHYIERKIGL